MKFANVAFVGLVVLGTLGGVFAWQVFLSMDITSMDGGSDKMVGSCIQNTMRVAGGELCNSPAGICAMPLCEAVRPLCQVTWFSFEDWKGAEEVRKEYTWERVVCPVVRYEACRCELTIKENKDGSLMITDCSPGAGVVIGFCPGGTYVTVMGC